MSIFGRYAGFTVPTYIMEMEERLHRHRRLANILEMAGGDFPSVRARIIQHERQAAEIEQQLKDVRLKDVRGW